MEVHESSHYYDTDGNPVDMDTWVQIRNSTDRVVAQEHVGRWWVSTVWVGLNHNLGIGTPLIFETMVFPTNEDGVVESYLEEYCDRYPTIDAARAGHDRAIAWAKDNLEERG